MNTTDVKAITEQLEAGMSEMFTSDRYREYLSFMSKFHDYSVNNIVLILLQHPTAGMVAGFKAWEKMGRHVKRGEKAIKILAPCPFKKTVTREVTENGVTTNEEQEIMIPRYKTVSVFADDQTEGKDIPTLSVDMLTGDVDGYNALLEKLIDIAGIPVDFEDITDGSNGYFSPSESRIAIKAGMSQMQTVKTLIHEIAHSMLHNELQSKIRPVDRDTKEVEAESVAYTVAAALGLDTGDYSFGYIAGWSQGREMKAVRASMDVIRKAASELISKIESASQDEEIAA